MFYLKMGQPRPLFHFFVYSNNTFYNFLQQINVKKYPSSIWCRDSNLQPLEHESPPITTRPGLPAIVHYGSRAVLNISTLAYLW